MKNCIVLYSCVRIYKINNDVKQCLYNIKSLKFYDLFY